MTKLAVVAASQVLSRDLVHWEDGGRIELRLLTRTGPTVAQQQRFGELLLRFIKEESNARTSTDEAG